MATNAPGQPSATPTPPSLDYLQAVGKSASVARIVERLGLWERPPTRGPRPLVRLNMISTADGRASLDGRSGPISNEADRALFHGLRSATDAVLVGAGTVRTERYGQMIRDPERRALRRRHELPPEPLACIVSSRLAFDASIPLFAEPAAHVVIVTNSLASLQACPAQVEYVRTPDSKPLDLTAALAELRERFDVRTLLCEGGPHLAWQLLAKGLVDEVFLSLAAKLAGGGEPAGEQAGEQALRILAGGELRPPIELELLDVMRGGSDLFLRYGVR